MKCGLYIRVSTEMQRDKGESLGIQLKRLKAYVESKEDWQVADVYKDAGISAKNTNRPEFNRMITDSKNKKIDVILCTKLDRLFRNTKNFLDTSDELNELGVQLVILEGNIDTTTASGELYSTMRAAFAQFERRTTAERVREHMSSRAEQGKWNGGITPYGYKSEKKELKLNTQEAEIVKIIYSLYLKQQSKRFVVQKLNADGYRTRKKELWTRTTIDRILTNPFYYGKLVYRKRSHDNNGKLRCNSKDKHIVATGSHPPIIAKELFDKVQIIIQHKRVIRPRTSQKYLMTGLIYCDLCGSRMHGMVTGRPNMKHAYYRCSAYVQKGNCQCSGNGVRVEKLENLIVGDLKNLSIDYNRVEKELKDTFDSNNEVDSRLRKLKNRLGNINLKRQKIVELYAESIIDKDVLLNRKKAIDEEESFIKKEIERLAKNQGGDILAYDFDNTLNLCKDMREVYDELDFQDRRELISNLLSEIRVNKHHADYSLQVLPKNSFLFANSNHTGRDSSLPQA